LRKKKREIKRENEEPDKRKQIPINILNLTFSIFTSNLVIYYLIFSGAGGAAEETAKISECE